MNKASVCIAILLAVLPLASVHSISSEKHRSKMATYINKLGSVIETQCSSSSGHYKFSEGLALFREKQIGFVDTKGKTAIPFQFDIAEPFSEGLAAAGRFGKMGFIDAKGTFLIKPLYERAKSFREGLAAVKINKKWGFIDKNGRLVIDALYDKVADFSEGVSAVEVEGLIGFMGKDGSWTIKPRNYMIVQGFSEGLALVGAVTNAKAQKYYIDKKGAMAFTLNPGQSTEGGISGSETALASSVDDVGNPTDDFSNFHQGLAVIGEDGKYGYVDHNGTFVIKPTFQSAAPFCEELACIKLEGKFGFINKSGQIVIRAQFQQAESFSEGLAAVKVEGKWGYIDKSGKFIISPAFSYADDFSEGFARVE